MNQDQVLLSKFKKKLWNSQKDNEGAQRRLRFLEKENTDLKTRVQELSERLGEDFSDMDENDRRRLMLRVDQELAQEKKTLIIDGNEGLIDVDQLPDRDVIKEEDTGTDMRDFERYLKQMYGERT